MFLTYIKLAFMASKQSMKQECLWMLRRGESLVCLDQKERFKIALRGSLCMMYSSHAGCLSGSHTFQKSCRKLGRIDVFRPKVEVDVTFGIDFPFRSFLRDPIALTLLRSAPPFLIPRNEPWNETRSP